MDPPEEILSLTGRPPRHPRPRGRGRGDLAGAAAAARTASDRFADRGWRRSLLLFAALCLTLALWIATRSEEGRIEAGLREGEAESVSHDDEILEGWDRDDGEEGESSAPGSSTKSPADAGSKQSKLLSGFHAAAPQSFVAASVRAKPKGAGYPLRPSGGTHPAYLADLDADEIGVASEGDYALSSPYADGRLRLSEEERREERARYERKLEAIRKEWGAWNFVDSVPDRPVVDWSQVEKKNSITGEIESDEFPKGVWQGDDQYIKNFHSEARSLLSRVREAVYAEYGLASSSLDPSRIPLRDVQMGIRLVRPEGAGAEGADASLGAAWMHAPSFRALAKKLLNAMMTNDHFFVVLGGHSAAAGHGNNFRQSYVLQFHSLMEPVFDRLGMVLVSANRAQGGMGTAQASLAGGSIYGEKDVVLWDSGMTEKSAGLQELFARQMLLTGHRVPILIDVGGGRGVMDSIRKESGAHVGGITTGTPSVMKLTRSAEQAEELPFALRHLFCDKGVSTCGEKQYKYNAKCWVERADVEPATKQNEGYGSQVSWHPGNRSHQWTARKLSLLFLHALEEAINIWESAASTDGNPIPGKYWHLSEEEDAIREKLRNVDANETECGKALPKLPRLCRTPMRGATEWAPRADPEHTSIRSLLKPAPNNYVPDIIDLEPQLYGGRDPHFPSQRVPEGEVDVEAIARSSPPPTGNERHLFAMPHRPYTNDGILQSVRESSLLRDESNTPSLRRLKSDEIVPGEGWTVMGHPAGFCDGTLNQVCHREPSSDCLMSGHADSRGVLRGDGLSGWATFQLKGVSQGIFAARIQAWEAHNSNARTEGWEAVNNGREDGRRELKPPPPPLPDDFAFEVAVNGELQYSLNGDELHEKCGDIAYNLPFCVLIDDEEMAKKNEERDMEVSIRIIGGGRESVLGITHVYYA